MTDPSSRCSRPVVLVAVTHPMSAILVRGQLAYTRRNGFHVVFLSSPGPNAAVIASAEGADVVSIPMEREISPWRDLVALARIIRVLLRIRPQVVNAGTPKAGLLVLLAARIVRVPHRVFTLRGLRSDGSRGARRLLLRAMERLTCSFAHDVICVGHALRDHAVAQGVVSAAKTHVLGKGSSNGVDVDRFAPTPRRVAAARELRASVGIPADACVLGFVGRIVRNKGIEELAEAWKLLRAEFPDLYLVLVGGHERGDPVSPEAVAAFETDARVMVTGQVDDPAPYFLLMDILALPSHREGFNNTLLEAAASALPVVTTRIPGCADAIVEGETGLLVPPRDAAALTSAVRTFLRDPELRRSYGAAGRRRVEADFRGEVVWRELMGIYRGRAPRVDGVEDGTTLMGEA